MLLRVAYRRQFIIFYYVFVLRAGEKAQKEFMFPEELVEEGCYEDWPAKVCHENLCKMASLYETPVKKAGEN